MKVLEEGPHCCSEDLGDPAYVRAGTLVECVCGNRWRAYHGFFSDAWRPEVAKKLAVAATTVPP